MLLSHFIFRIRTFVLLICFACLVFCGCRKEKDVKCDPTEEYNLTPFEKQFFFTKNSFWTFKNIADSSQHTLTVVNTEGPGIHYYGPDGHMNPCISATQQTFSVTMEMKTLFRNPISIWRRAEGLFFGNSIAVHEVVTNDTLKAPAKSKLEKIFPELIIQGVTFKNVYQMWYSVSEFGMRRVWWVPGLGIIKFELVDTNKQGFEIFELLNFKSEIHP